MLLFVVEGNLDSFIGTDESKNRWTNHINVTKNSSCTDNNNSFNPPGAAVEEEEEEEEEEALFISL